MVSSKGDGMEMSLRDKILLVGPLPPPVGGMATMMENLAGALRDRCDVRVLDNVKTTRKDRALAEGVAAQLKLLVRLAGFCLFWHPRVVHIHTCSWFTFWRNGVDVLLARLLGRRVVLHIHGGRFHKFLGSLSPGRARLARGVFRLTDRVIVLGAEWKRLLDQWCDPARVVIVPNGVPVPTPVSADRQDDAFSVICLGNYEKQKGQQDLIQAMAAVHCAIPVRLTLLGAESEPGQESALAALADSLGLTGQVDLPGPVMGAAKWDYLRQASCFCLPSYDEGLPMSMLEAMALGLPVVVTRVGAIPEAVTDGEHGLLYEAGDVAALTDCLQRLIDGPGLAQRIGAGARERLIRDFSLDRSVERILETYRELCGRQG